MNEALSIFAIGPDGWGDELLRGMYVTASISFVGMMMALVLGALFCTLKLSGVAVLRWVASFYTTVFRGVPELLIIYLVFFGGEELLHQIAATFFGIDARPRLPVFWIGAIALALGAGAYTTETLRGAYNAVPKGQLEAAKAIGLTRLDAFWSVVFPQMMRHALPGLSNIWQLVLKESALLSVIGVVEIMRSASLAVGSTRLPFTFYLAAAILFMTITALSEFGLKRLSVRANRGGL